LNLNNVGNIDIYQPTQPKSSPLFLNCLSMKKSILVVSFRRSVNTEQLTCLKSPEDLKIYPIYGSYRNRVIVCTLVLTVHYMVHCKFYSEISCCKNQLFVEKKTLCRGLA